MMTGKKDVAMKESKNDDIDRKNKVIIRISFADEVKHFFLRACMEEDDVITLLIPGYQIIFGPRRDKLFCPMSSVILCFICRVKA